MLKFLPFRKARPQATAPHQPQRVGSVVVSQGQEQTLGFFSVRNQLRSIIVGIASGGAVVLVFLFVLFNEMFIVPFIQPGSNADPAPVVDQAGAPIDQSPKISIPKISVDIPVVYGLESTDENQFELALDKGVVHYPTTVQPGQAGNAAFFGHSSNNIFNPGKYKFAFVLLHELETNDTFYLSNGGTLYTYEVISKQVVKPTEVGVLGSVPGQLATATLITCDPPGTSNNRLVVVGKQISPDPNASQAVARAQPEVGQQATTSESLPGNGPGLLTRLWRSVVNE